jgi:endogenous inhibitor of DNA gyrase (YacG/DUF329 family)
MAYKCPRCGGKVSRIYDRGSQEAAGLIGLLLVAAFGPFDCKRCGSLDFGEFPASARVQMVLGSVVLLVGALALVAAGIILLLKAR